MSSSPTGKADQRRLGREVADYFLNDLNVSFVGFAGVGRHGGALILEQKGGDRPPRKLVVKYSLGALSTDKDSDSDEHLRNEYRWLQMLQGAEHIVQLVPFADCSMNLPGISNGESTFEKSKENEAIREEAQAKQGETSANGDKITKEPSRGRRCPTFALEYLPNGTLYQLAIKIYEAGVRIPNRLLWMMWLCMVRQCVAMAFPPNIPAESYGGQKIRERIRPNQQYFPLTQNSPHMDNYVFGTEPGPYPDSDHDPSVPVLKLIDFGRGEVEDVNIFTNQIPDIYEGGSRMNLSNATDAMMNICLPHISSDLLEQDNPSVYRYVENKEVKRVTTTAPKVFREDDTIDVRLRDRLVRLQARRFGDIPSLNETLEEAEMQVKSMKPDGDSKPSDSDDDIKSFVQRFFYD
ncbi:hypothetical protein F5Y10DRAFT_271341 [Nemania abortiva]|nr:hypothetical protein F5Y10DRAFT_271341 [Nemania abortiva]